MFKLKEISVLVFLTVLSAGCFDTNGQWVYDYDARLIVAVGAEKDSVKGDEGPVQSHIDFKELLAKARIKQMPDINSIRVVQFDEQSGKPIEYGKWAYAKTKYEVPFRWYDDEIPYQFPEYEGTLTSSYGLYKGWMRRPQWGYFYDCIGSWESGRLVWLGRKEKEKKTYYAVYFNFLKKGQRPYRVPPRGFVGDGLNRCVKEGAEVTTGLIHSRVDVDDYDNDGLIDMIVGCARGGVIWYPNVGSAQKPKFAYSKMIFTTDGKPLDIGWSATPKVFDFNGDGKKDLLIGLEWNSIAFFENVGSNSERKYVYRGLVKNEKGRNVSVPHRPCPEGILDDGRQVYTRDYYPVIDFADIDGDGRQDLFVGGYVTGMIFYYRNTGTKEDGTPKLQYVGPIKADGNDLDVGWAAAPGFYDFNGDGKLDLVVGNMKMTAGGGDATSSEYFLHYYENTGSKTAYEYAERKFPKEGTFPKAALSTPRAADMNKDGLVDLVVSYNDKISIYYNKGTAKSSLFEVHKDRIPMPWANDGLSGYQFIDYNGDGRKDLVNGWQVALNDGLGNPWEFEAIEDAAEGQSIELHLSGIGDDWQFKRIYDLDNDGDFDLMNADHSGHVWFHENKGTKFNPNGVRLSLTNGKLVQVGPAALEGETPAFDKLQGARTTYTVGDFDKDGRNDIVVGDTFGYVRYYRGADTVKFEPPIKIGKLSNRLVPAAVDWDNDGYMDVVVVASSTSAYVFMNLGKQASKEHQFSPMRAIGIGGSPYGAGAPILVADLNGDGDKDLVLYTAYNYCCWYEGSFIKRGYVEGQIKRIERR